MSQPDVAHLQHPNNILTKYELPIPHGSQDTVQTRFSHMPDHPPKKTPWVKTTPAQPLKA